MVGLQTSVGHHVEVGGIHLGHGGASSGGQPSSRGPGGQVENGKLMWGVGEHTKATKAVQRPGNKASYQTDV